MEHQPEDLLGDPVDEVPQLEPNEHCNARRSRDGQFLGYCKRVSGWGTDDDTGRCSLHGGNAGAPEGNDNAVTVETWSEDFVKNFLTEGEKDLVEDARELLNDDATAKELGATAAGIALVQFRRTGDERFFRRFESLCDTFNIAPDDVERKEFTGDGGGAIEVDVTNNIVETEATDGDE